MHLQKLTIGTMRALAEGWRTDNRAVLASPYLAFLPAMLDAWAEDAKQLDGANRDAAVARMRDENTALDAVHDGEFEACYAYLTGLAAVHPDPVAVTALRDDLMPDGRRMKTRSYQEQGIAAENARGLLTDAVKAQLQAFSPEGVDLVARVQAWIDAGLELQRKDRVRAGLENEGSQRVRELRTRWLRMLRALRSGAELADLDASTEAQLFGKLDEALRARR